ncbi:MAG: thiol reductant ABC exporter subunit CydC [Limosilactobacillus sp.]|uniref:thiol reductant ABC exporter subunit CydC n=1 Tax=Limosilactobacillus sp. TaxID=2773925 RepID=UPI00270B5B2E|nr:thiol reductant ABC exporter subunit CydC [Limosilactobacillus sp.]
MLNKVPLLKALKNDNWVRPFLRHYRKTLILAISLGILTFVCGAGLMFVAGYLISKSATHPDNILLVYVPIVLTRAFGIGRPAFRYFERLVSHNWVLRMTSRLRQKLYDTLEFDATKLNSKYQLGDILGLLSDDIHHIQNLYLRTMFPMFVSWGLYTIIVVGIGYLSIWMGLWMLVVFGLMIFAIPLWSVLINGARQELQKQVKDDLYVNLTDNVMGVGDWVLSGRSDAYMSLHNDNEKQFAESEKAMNRFERWRDFLIQMLILVVAVSLIIWGASEFGGQHGGAANWIAAFVLAVFPLVDAFAPLPAAAQETNVYTDSLVRLNNLDDHADRIQEEVESAEGPYSLAVEDVHYTYPNTTKEVLKGVSLKVNAGEKLAILGKSGAGKSTLAALLRGDRTPTSGSIELNGIDTSKFGDHISNYISVINQSPYLFNTTIANNIRLGNEDATDEQIWDVLRRVGLEKMVKALPDGIETMVDEAGLRFSGGERHRMSLARILLKDSPIVILDEPTVGLDPITEQSVINTIFEQLDGKTLIWITHHLQGIDEVDQVIFIEDGQIEMHGTPAELWANNQRYQELKKADQGL